LSYQLLLNLGDSIFAFKWSARSLDTTGYELTPHIYLLAVQSRHHSIHLQGSNHYCSHPSHDLTSLSPAVSYLCVPCQQSELIQSPVISVGHLLPVLLSQVVFYFQRVSVSRTPSRRLVAKCVCMWQVYPKHAWHYVDCIALHKT